MAQIETVGVLADQQHAHRIGSCEAIVDHARDN
jgi:hypothetical protein